MERLHVPKLLLLRTWRKDWAGRYHVQLHIPYGGLWEMTAVEVKQWYHFSITTLDVPI